MDGLPFVTGAIWHQPRDVTVQVKVREPRKKSRLPPGSAGGKSSNDSKDAAARQLTRQITDAKSATELLSLLDEEVDGPIFNYFHASAAYSGLATWKWKIGLKPSDKESPVLPRLAARVQNMIEEGQVEPRTVANVLYSLGKLSDDVEVPEGLLTALVKSAGDKASGMDPQGLSNSLLAFEQLKGGAPEVLAAVPQVAAQISFKATDMVPQALSNSLWAFAHLKDDVDREVVAKLVIALACQIQDKAKDMVPQALSNSLWAAARLKDIVPEVKEIVPAIVAQIQDKAKDMIPQHVSNCLWAATRLKDDASEVLRMVPALVEEIPRNQADFSSQAICNCLEALVLLRDSVPEVGSFLGAPPNSKNDFVGFASSRFSTLLPRLKGKSLAFQMPVVVWACAKINSYHEELLVSVAQRAKSDGTLQRLTDWSLCAMLWSYDVLDTKARFANFRKALESERVRRRLSDSDVSESAFGYFEWNRAKG